MKKIKYPIKLGFKDRSGMDENYITDSNDNVLVRGFGDCCRSGGIKDRHIAISIIELFNKNKPKIYF